MSKRSRTDFEGGLLAKGDGSRQIKRIRKEKQSNNESSLPEALSSDFMDECPICYEHFTDKIFQCQEGHLLCHLCRPKFVNCPTCRISLSSNIRNRILEQILATKTKHKPSSSSSSSSQQQQKANKKNKIKCCLCKKSYKSQTGLNKHYNNCGLRKIYCPFTDCEWIGSYDDFMKHAKDLHHTCIGSVVSRDAALHDTNQYAFNHAIKFPKDTFSRVNADFVWPKIVRFDDGTHFFIKIQYKAGFITIFVRLMTLSKLKKDEIKLLSNDNYYDEINDGEGEKFGTYWIEFRVKDEQKENKNNKNKKDKKQDKDKDGFGAAPLRWPSHLYGVTVPFNFEKKKHEALKVHHHIFTRYWVQENKQTSAILRFQFYADLK